MSRLMAQQLCSKQHCATDNTRRHHNQCRIEVSNAHTHKSSTVRLTFGSLHEPAFVLAGRQAALFQPPGPETENTYCSQWRVVLRTEIWECAGQWRVVLRKEVWDCAGQWRVVLRTEIWDCAGQWRVVLRTEIWECAGQWRVVLRT